jgi:serine protease Do
MNSNRLFRTALPTLSFLIAFAGTAGLTLSGADKKSPAPTQKKASAADTKKSPADAKSDEKRAPLKISVDTKPINRDAADRVSYAPIIKRTASSVVYVHSSKTVRGQDLTPFLNDPMFRRFFDIPGLRPDDENGTLTPDDSGKSTPRATPKGNNRNRGNNNNNNRGGGTVPRSNRMPNRVQEGLGSGVVITADGYILTNNHVVEGADDVKVSIGEATKRHEAKVVGRDPFTDIAVLKIDASELSPATFGDSDQVQVGDVVLAIGNPFGVGQSVSRGIVSALGRGIGIGPIEDFIQTDAAINPGNSGGALLDTEGRVVGINTAIASGTGGFAGVGFAIPINLARSVAEQLVNTGRVDRAFLGVTPQDLAEDLATQFGTEKGALITNVEPDSPAEKIGLKAGDVITKVNATEIRDSRHLLLTIAQMKPETQVTLEYIRENKKATTTTKLGRRPEQATASTEIPDTGKDVGVLNGVGVGDITSQIRDQLQLPARINGALITNVDPDSPSAKQGLREGDIILELDRKPVTNAEEAVKLSEEIKGPKVLVLLWRNGQRRYVVVDESKE